MVATHPIRFADLRIGDRVSGIVCAWTCQANRTRSGSPYLSFELRDDTATLIPGVMWDTDAERAPICPVILHISGDVGDFRDEMQIRIQSMKVTDYDIGDYVPTTYRPMAELTDELQGVVELIADDALRSLVNECLARTPGFWTAPAAIGFHGAYRGGLLEHTLNVTRLCLYAADVYGERVNQDLLIAVGVLHDIGKADAYESPERREPFEHERLIGHVVRGAMIVEQTARETGYISDIPIEDLLHALLSHHGELEFGAPIQPGTAEALILCNADRMEADVTGCFDHWRDRAGSEAWSYSRQRQGWVRRPTQQREKPAYAIDDLPF